MMAENTTFEYFPMVAEDRVKDFAEKVNETSAYYATNFL